MTIATDRAAGSPGDAAPVGLRWRQVAAVTAGNGLEFYDFLVYSTFAIYIGRAYFPTHDPVIGLLLSLATFGIGFITRPIGSLVLGRLGDRKGRKPAMLLAFGLMAVGLLGLAATPTYAQIGVASPLLAVFFRLVQGFALGGEVGPSTAFLVEASAAPRRGLVGSMQVASQGFAFIASSGVAVGLSYLLPPDALADWGWRLAFLVGLLIVPFGLLVRRSLPEPGPASPRPPGEHSRGQADIPWRLVCLSVMLIASGTINTYVNTYMVTYAMDTMHLSARSAFSVGLVNGGCMLIFAPLGGWLSDRFGRRALMIPAGIALVLLPLPVYSLILAYPSAAVLNAAMSLVMIPAAMAGGAMLVSITESFPVRMRCLAVGMIYAGAVAVFGGTTQVAVSWLLHLTGEPLVPAYYRIAASLIGLAAVLNMTESAPAKAPVLRPAHGLGQA